VAQVVLENIYKSFPRRSGKSAIAPPPALEQELDSSTLSNVVPPSADNGQADTALVNVLRRINLTVSDGEFMVLVGPSGCGKSTLLRLIAGLETLTAGNIWVGDRLVNELPPKQRDIAMVFQSYALYPHMTVYENLAFGLRRTGFKANPQVSQIDPISPPVSSNQAKPLGVWAENALTSVTRALPHSFRYQSNQEKAINQQVHTVARMLQIDPLLDRLPRQLSGGQKQRVALGRAMARNPQVFLMDEPLSNLDAKLRAETRTQIVNLQRQLGITTIYVTHDQTEAMTMGDRIAIMNAGQIQQLATPLDVYNHPANRFVAEFIGSPPMNFIPVQVKAPLLISHPQFRLTLPEGWEARLQPYDGKTLTLGIRPEHLSISVPAPKNIPVQVERLEFLGSETYLTARITESSPAVTIQARVAPDAEIHSGDQLWLALLPEKVHLFDDRSSNAIA
jgi:multiple sugar transport system ATP-binding protein